MRPVRRAIRIGDGDPIPHPGSVWVANNRQTLKNNFWVAANETGLVAEDPMIDGLIEQLNKKNYDLASLFIAYISSDPRI